MNEFQQLIEQYLANMKLSASQEEIGKDNEENDELVQEALRINQNARKAQQNDKLTEALNLYKESLFRVRLPVVINNLAQLYIKLQQYDEAYNLFEEAFREGYKSSSFQLFNMIITFSMKKGYKYVITQLLENRQNWNYEKIKQLSPISQSYEYMRERFFNLYKRFFENDEEEILADYAVQGIRILFYSGHINISQELNLYLIHSHSRTIDYIDQMVKNLIELERNDEALILLNYLISNYQKNKKYYIQLSQIYLKNKQFVKCIDIIQSCITVLPNQKSSYVNLMTAFQYASQINKGIEYFDQEINQCKDILDLYINKLFALLKLELYEELLIYITNLEKQFGTNQYQLIKYKAKAFFELQQYDRTIEQTQIMEQIKPASSKQYIIQGTCYLIQQKFSLFLQSLNKALLLKPFGKNVLQMSRKYYLLIGNYNLIFKSYKIQSEIEKTLLYYSKIATDFYYIFLDSEMSFIFKLHFAQLAQVNYPDDQEMFYLSRLILQWESFRTEKSRNFLIYFLTVKWIIMVFAFQLNDDPLALIYLESEFNDIAMEYPLKNNIFSLMQQKIKMKKYQMEKCYSFQFQYQFGLALDYVFHKRLCQFSFTEKKYEHIPNGLLQTNQQFNNDIQKQALDDCMIILRAIQNKTIDLYIPSYNTCKIIETLI